MVALSPETQIPEVPTEPSGPHGATGLALPMGIALGWGFCSGALQYALVGVSANAVGFAPFSTSLTHEAGPERVCQDVS